MNAKRWIAVALLSFLAGAIWATGYAEWGPSWINRLNPLMASALMLLPFAVLLVCALVFDWWRWPATLLYVVILAVCGSIAITRDEKLFGCACCRGGSWYGSLFESFGSALFLIGPLLAFLWALGRLGRRVLRKGPQTADSRQPTE